MIVHGIADFLGDCHSGADVGAVDEMLGLPDVLAVVQRVLVDDVASAVKVACDVGDMAGRGAVV